MNQVTTMPQWKLTKTFETAQGVVRYDTQGEGPPLVFVHGTPWSSFVWRHLIREFARQWTVYTYDLIGYGQSEKREGQDVSLGVQNRILAELLDHWGLERPSIVGHDFGGTTVLRTHLLDGRDFRRMVLIDPVALAPWGSPFVQHVKTHYEAFTGIPPYMHEAMVAAYVKNAPYQELDAETIRGLIEPWLDPSGQAALYRQIAQMDQRFTDEIEPLYPEIRCPVLIIWGEEDSWVPVSKGRQLHEAIPGSRFQTVPDAGHLVMEEAPNAVKTALDDFLTTEQARS